MEQPIPLNLKIKYMSKEQSHNFQAAIIIITAFLIIAIMDAI